MLYLIRQLVRIIGYALGLNVWYPPDVWKDIDSPNYFLSLMPLELRHFGLRIEKCEDSDAKVCAKALLDISHMLAYQLTNLYNVIEYAEKGGDAIMCDVEGNEVMILHRIDKSNKENSVEKDS